MYYDVLGCTVTPYMVPPIYAPLGAANGPGGVCVGGGGGGAVGSLPLPQLVPHFFVVLSG